MRAKIKCKKKQNQQIKITNSSESSHQLYCIFMGRCDEFTILHCLTRFCIVDSISFHISYISHGTKRKNCIIFGSSARSAIGVVEIFIAFGWCDDDVLTFSTRIFSFSSLNQSRNTLNIPKMFYFCHHI